VFSGFILYDTQKILKHARLAQMGAMVRDPIRESVSLIIDAINLCTSSPALRPSADYTDFLMIAVVRIVQVLMLQQRKK
jgi:hypothetical protein